MQQIKKVYVVITTHKMDESIKFYSEYLGMEVKHHTKNPNGKMVILENAANSAITLFEPSEGSPMLNMPEGSVHLRTNVDSLEELIITLSNTEYYSDDCLFRFSYGNAINIKDPNGLPLTIMEHQKD